MDDTQNALLDTASQVLDWAQAAGATAADATAARNTEFEVKVADGEIVTLTQATSKGLGIRVFVGQQMGFCTTTDFQPDNLRAAVERAVVMAKETAEDPYNGLPPQAQPGVIEAGEELELFDPAIEALSAEQKIAWAHELEAAARGADPRVTKFRDSGVETNSFQSILVSTTGVTRTLRSTGITIWCNPIAEGDGQLQTEVWYDAKVHLDDLESIESVGRTAGQRAARMLGAKPIASQEVPVIFEPHMAAGLFAGILGALNGDMVYKKASFLADRLGTQIATENLTLFDDPLLPRGLASTPFDGEGLQTEKKALIERGKLTTFLYDSYTARKAGVAPTANARRGHTTLPHTGPFNLYVDKGTQSAEDIIQSTDKALLLTRALGHGVNTVSGEYSRGANGLWIENGEIQYPVQEVTIAGDFLEMLNHIDAFGSDWMMRGSVGAPTVRITPMTVAGT